MYISDRYILVKALDVSITFLDCIFIVFILNVGTAIPVSVANLGTFEASVVIALSQFGVGSSVGAAVAVAHHMIQVSSVFVCAVLLRASASKESIREKL